MGGRRQQEGLRLQHQRRTAWLLDGRTLHRLRQVEGIATNGTDVWIVDNKATRCSATPTPPAALSGSQNAASSFSLNSGNRNPNDIVTDGTYLWVVNDSTTDKVFKYTLCGNARRQLDHHHRRRQHPTGITLDPTNVPHLWIVDSGTDRVYQYKNAARRTGSKSADASFALAAGNTNPQGIADPPRLGGEPRVAGDAPLLQRPRPQ